MVMVKRWKRNLLTYLFSLLGGTTALLGGGKIDNSLATEAPKKDITTQTAVQTTAPDSLYLQKPDLNMLRSVDPDSLYLQKLDLNSLRPVDLEKMIITQQLEIQMRMVELETLMQSLQQKLQQTPGTN